MTAVLILLSPFGVVFFLLFLEYAVPYFEMREGSGVPTSDQEALRQVIQRHTGREISELVLEHGHWYARTARGLEPVEELLRSGHVRMGMM